jgi:glycosyltransferase involved in cell wall biosynthesis
VFDSHRVTLVIPALNEEKGVIATIERSPPGIDEIIVVDGGSSDATQSNARALGARVIPQLVRGYGLAYKTGFLESKGDIIVTGDADGTYPIERAPAIIREMDARGLDFVSCSRFPLVEAGSMERLNNVGNRLISLWSSMVSMRRFQDVLSGMWILRRKVLPELRLIANGWNFSAEVKLEAAWQLRTRFAEIHIPYADRVGMTHNTRPFRIGGENCLFILYKRCSQVYRRSLMTKTEDQIRAARGDSPSEVPLREVK